MDTAEQERIIPVHCAHDEIVDLEKIKPNPSNPNKHPERQVKLLAKIIGKQGWRAPITVSTRSGLIVRGEGRYKAALELNCKKVPIDYQDYESESEEMADLLADNRISELAELNMSEVVNILVEMNDGQFDMDLTGYDYKDLEALMVGSTFDKYEIPEQSDVSAEMKMITCPNCGKEFPV